MKSNISIYLLSKMDSSSLTSSNPLRESSLDTIDLASYKFFLIFVGLSRSV